MQFEISDREIDYLLENLEDVYLTNHFGNRENKEHPINPEWFQIIAYQGNQIATSQFGTQLVFQTEKLQQAEKKAIELLIHQYHVDRVIFFSERLRDRNGKAFKFELNRQDGIARLLDK